MSINGLVKKEGTNRRFWFVANQLDQGWSTRSFPSQISDRQVYVADNVVFNRDGIISKRPGNIYYGGGSGAVGTGMASLSGFRFYPSSGAAQLLVQSGGNLYKGNDSTGAFTMVGTGLSTTNKATYCQTFDPDMSTGAATAVIICDGASVPHIYDGTNYTQVHTGTYTGPPAGNWLPTGRAGSPITPAYVCNWKYHLVYAGQPDEPTAVYISDPQRPEAFNGYSLLTTSNTPYIAYYPAGRDGVSGKITGISTVGQFIVVFYQNAIYVGYNTGTYGAENFEWFPLSVGIGCVAPFSIVNFGTYIVFFGGDRFYATDANTTAPLPDEIPSVYANGSNSVFPSEMTNKATVVAARRGLQYIAGYDNTNSGVAQSAVVFDQSAASGWSYGSATGGAWSRWPSGMPISWMVECRNGVDVNTFPVFWGSSLSDVIAEFDTGIYSDFGNDIGIEIRLKAFYFDRPIWPKDLQKVWINAAAPYPYGSAGSGYQNTVQVYANLDFSQANSVPVTFSNNVIGVKYGSGVQYGNVEYGISGTILSEYVEAFINQDAKSSIIQPGLIEKSSFPFNFVGMVLDFVLDNPQT